MEGTNVRMKGPGRTAEQATRIVADFLTSTSAFNLVGAWARPVAARRKGDAWGVRMDVGALVNRILEFGGDGATGGGREWGRKGREGDAPRRFGWVRPAAEPLSRERAQDAS